MKGVVVAKPISHKVVKQETSFLHFISSLEPFSFSNFLYWGETLFIPFFMIITSLLFFLLYLNKPVSDFFSLLPPNMVLGSHDFNHVTFCSGGGIIFETIHTRRYGSVEKDQSTLFHRLFQVFDAVIGLVLSTLFIGRLDLSFGIQ